VYSHTIPPPAVAVLTRPPKETPSAVFAWAGVGHVAAPSATAPVVALVDGSVVADVVVVEDDVEDDVEPALGAPVPDPQPASSPPITRAPTIRGARIFIPTTIRP